MLPVERRDKILQLVDEQQCLKISELSEILHVSEMTVHRDLAPLVNKGLIIKTFGGIMRPPIKQEKEKNICIYCRKDYQKHLSYRLILPCDTVEIACCAHCGFLRHHQLDGKISHALVNDFLKQTTINALTATYVMNTTLNLNCCQPQVLPFEHKKHAEQFIRGFTGDIYSFQEAKQLVFNQMTCEMDIF